MKLACVVQRYGKDIAGGSEAHCRELAVRLAVSHDVTVLTSCARDYVTWANAFPAGETTEQGVRIRRFPVSQTRRLKRFADLSDAVFDGAASHEQQEAWFRENGPDVPELLEHLRSRPDQYDLVLFWTYRYAPSYFGLPIVADRAVLLPTAESDSAIDLNILEEFFQKPAGYLFLTPEEEALVSTRAGRPLTPSAVIGTGVEAAPPARPPVPAHLGLSGDYVLYLGRVDRNKGCDTLLEYFQEYAARSEEQDPAYKTSSRASLVLAGPSKMRIPDHPRIRALGYVSDQDRHALLSHARALIVPSPYESLSIVLLEAWNHAVPALVNAHCSVLKGQVRRAEGGLYYRSSREFTEALTYLLSHEPERVAFGRQGLSYVDREYRWPGVMSRVEQLLDDVVAGSRRT